MRQAYDILKRHHRIAIPMMLLSFVYGCSEGIDDPAAPISDSKFIEFFAGAESSGTRAAAGHPVDGERFPASQSFGVYAYQIGFGGTNTVEVFANPDSGTPAAAFDNKEVSSDAAGTNLSYEPKVVWPHMSSGRSLRFFAYYPWVSQTTPDSSDPKITLSQTGGEEKVAIGYTLDEDPSKHVDLMYWMGDRISAPATEVDVLLKHALTRVNFEARIGNYPDNTDIVVKQIKIKNAVRQGTLNVNPAPAGAQWQLGTSRGDITMTTASGLQTTAIGTSYAPILVDTGKDMLVIPQSAAGLKMEITVGINGIDKTFDHTLSGGDWVMNQSVTYQFTFDWTGIEVAAQVADWNRTMRENVVFDGQFYLKASHPAAHLMTYGGSRTLTFTTNYTGDYDGNGSHDTGAFPAGMRVTKGPDSSWLALNDGGDVYNGTTYSRSIAVSAGYTDTSRNAYFTVSAGNMNLVIQADQTAGINDWVYVYSDTGGYYPLDGEEHSFTIQSTSNWKIVEVNDPDDILLTRETWLDRSVTPVWDGSKDNYSFYFRFFFKGHTTAGQSAYMVIRDQTGVYPDKIFTIHAI